MADNPLDKIKIGHLNTRSLVSSFVNVSNFIVQNHFSIFCLTETWLTKDTPSNLISIPGYNILRRDREAGRGGGVAIYFRSNYRVEEIKLDFLNEHDLNEHLWINIRRGVYSFAVGVIYRPPQNNITQCIQCVDNIMSYLTPLINTIIVTGDININLFNLNNPLTVCFDAYGFSQVVDEPTRVTEFSSTLIDPIFVSTIDLVINHGTINADEISDHRAVWCMLNIPEGKNRSKLYTFRDFKQFDQNSFLSDLQMFNWNQLLYIRDINLKIQYLTDGILSLFNRHAPVRTVRLSKPYAPWRTDTIKLLQKERDIAFVKYKHNKTAQNFSNYKTVRNLYTAALRREQSAYLKFSENENSNKIWKRLKALNILSKQKSELPTELRDPNTLNEHFLNNFTADNVNDNIKNYYATHTHGDGSFSFSLVTPEIIRKIVSNMSSNACGSDNISLIMIKLSLPVLSPYITHIINICLETGYFPEVWKIAVVSPVPKKSNPTCFNDLRPISLLPVLSKILEKVVCIQLTDYFNEHHLFPINQSGFRTGYSTTALLLNISDNIIRTLDKSMATVVVLLDFSKAFDCVNHELLCLKLKYYGLDDIAINFFYSYLFDRSQFIRTNCGTSITSRVTSGVPQGSILGPLLFLVYTFDMSRVINTTTLFSYADDQQLLYTFNPTQDNIEIVSRNINSDLSALNMHCKGHNLKLNPQKTITMLFSPKSAYARLKANLKISIEDEVLTFVESARNLGVIFDTKLRFQEHLSNVMKKCYSRLKILYSNKLIINFKTRKKLCECFVLPLFYYCLILYYPCLDMLSKNRIQKVQNTCCRFVCNLRKYDHISSKFSELNWLKIEETFKYHLLLFTHRLMLTSIPSYLKEKIVYRNQIHDRNIRSDLTLTMPHHSTALFQRSYTFNAVRSYNNIDNILKCLNIYCFKKKLKQDLIRHGSRTNL